MNDRNRALEIQLSSNITEAEWALVQHIVGNCRDSKLLQYAESVARAHLDLVRVRQIKAGFLNRMMDLGVLAPRFDALPIELHHLKYPLFGPPVNWPTIDFPWESTAADKEADAAEAQLLLWLLNEIRKLDRYEARAYATKINAMREVSLRMRSNKVKP